MASEQRTEKGVVFTFYSFKGGTGRSMALANVAVLMARWGYRVLVVDWDLEAPGLEYFFRELRPGVSQLRAKLPGIVDLIKAVADGDQRPDWRNCVIDLSKNLSLISAGREHSDYVSKVQGLDFNSLFSVSGLGAYIEKLRNEWAAEFEFVLVDSRTGITDIGGICTVHLPDVLVLLLTATQSSLEGGAEIVRRARLARERLPLDRGRLLVLPVPARDESRSEYERAQEWKRRIAIQFEDSYKDWLPTRVSSSEAVEVIRIPYVPYWSFGEQLPVLADEASDPSSMGYAYNLLARLLSTRLDWYHAVEGRMPSAAPTRKPRSLNTEWLSAHRTAAIAGLQRSGRNGFMEIYHFCPKWQTELAQQELLQAADQSMVHTFGWPIGVVLRNRDDLKPRPTSEGIFADVPTDHDYDYWALTKQGDFYSLISLFEDDREKGVIYFDTRIIRTAEVILHCISLYKNLGVPPGTEVMLTLRYGGLKGRVLKSVGTRWITPAKNHAEDEVSSSVAFDVGVDETAVSPLVQALCAPLFILFDFKQFSDTVYSQIVTNFIKGKL